MKSTGKIVRCHSPPREAKFENLSYCSIKTAAAVTGRFGCWYRMARKPTHPVQPFSHSIFFDAAKGTEDRGHAERRVNGRISRRDPPKVTIYGVSPPPPPNRGTHMALPSIRKKVGTRCRSPSYDLFLEGCTSHPSCDSLNTWHGSSRLVQAIFCLGW